MRRTKTSAAILGIAALTLAGCSTGTTSDGPGDTPAAPTDAAPT